VEGILRETPSEQLRDMDCSRIRENASIAREQVLRCRGVTQNFLRMSRGTRSAGVAIDISECIASVRKLVEPTARSQSVRVDVLPIPDGLFVRGDESELQNVLINLILNAIQACKPGGQVVLKATAGTALHLSVADNGRGIAPENLKRIFEPFFSLSEGGTGLGLFLSLETTRRWGGDILVTSTEAGGATFEVVLPLLESKVEDAAAV
jgi:two-component system NtrC family sensor kinase